MEKLSLTQDLEYLAIFSLVLILPKVLLRLKIPTGITALTIGLFFGYFDPAIKEDTLFRFLSQIGITSLFVFAGLEVNFKELHEDRVYLSKYILKSTVALLLVSWGISDYFDLNYQNSLILTLGILTPSAGFIINSLHSFDMTKDHEYWIKSKAISKELVAIILMFIALQINDLKAMAISLGFFAVLLIVMPVLFKFFFKFVSPYTPNSEVPLLVVLSLICGVISKELGAYYLVGAFMVGLVGSRFKHEIFKDNEESIFTSLNSFFNVFLPFYFFFAGLKMPLKNFTWDAAQIGIVLLLIFVPLRIVLNSLSLKYLLKDFVNQSYRVSLSLMPTLIFGLVIAGILIERGEVPTVYIYALIVYTLISSLLPTILFNFQKKEAVTEEQS